jgi:Ca-activated chloride channel family protein
MARLSALPAVCRITALGLIAVALARPETYREEEHTVQGIDIMFVLDLSKSMEETDLPLNRLDAGQRVIRQFISRREGDRIGLVVFGQRAYALAPMTLDLQSVQHQLDTSVVGLAGRETAIGDAIGLAVKRLSQQESGQRVLVLLTDGMNTAGRLDPLKAAEIARDNGVRIHAIAFGGDSGGFSVFGMPVQLPGAGNDSDEATLRRIAESTGGKAFRARDAGELAGIYAEIDRLEPVDRAARPVRPRIERYPWPLAAALLLALLAFALPAHGRGRGSPA